MPEEKGQQQRGFSAMKPQSHRYQGSEAESIKTARGHLEAKLQMSAGLFESWSRGVNTMPGPPDKEGMGTEPYPNKAGVLETEGVV